MSLQEGGKRLLDVFDEIGQKRSRSCSALEEEQQPQGPLHGVVICLTGLTSDKKSRLHTLVEKLGGSYTRDFNIDRNTHLVAEIGQGAKYELAASHPKIHIVTPSWLEDCERTGTHADEASHPVRVTHQSGKHSQKFSSPATKKPTYRQIFEILLRDSKVARSLFEFHIFYLLGFEDAPEVKRLLGRVIRRGGGTIHWELSDDVTTLIVHDTCHEALRKASQVISSLHPNLPPTVSPRWVIDSFRRKSLVPVAKYPPIKARNLAQKATTKPSKTSISRSSSTPASVFRGSLFALARIAPPTGAVDFDSKDQETLIRAHGGQILTLKLMDAMKADSKNLGHRRECFVVCWGGAPRLELNPILSQMKRHNICDLLLVTPIWLQSCISLQEMVQPSRLPEALVPRTWPFKRMEKKLDLRVSVTGFSAMEKEVLTNLMTTCGISFHNEMTISNTHLICKEKATGLKLQKALEWGLHIVSVEWLYYILQHGFNGKESSKQGCEDQFSLKPADTETETEEK